MSTFLVGHLTRALFVLLCASTVFAQSSGSLRGTVTDPSKGVLPGEALERYLRRHCTGVVRDRGPDASDDGSAGDTSGGRSEGHTAREVGTSRA